MFDDWIVRIKLMIEQMENQPEDAHELLEKIHLELNQLRATGQPLPEDLLALEQGLMHDFRNAKRQGKRKKNS